MSCGRFTAVSAMPDNDQLLNNPARMLRTSANVLQRKNSHVTFIKMNVVSHETKRIGLLWLIMAVWLLNVFCTTSAAAWIAPQTMNMTVVPCHNAATVMVIIRFRLRCMADTRLPPSGM